MQSILLSLVQTIDLIQFVLETLAKHAELDKRVTNRLGGLSCNTMWGIVVRFFITWLLVLNGKTMGMLWYVSTYCWDTELQETVEEEPFNARFYTCEQEQHVHLVLKQV